MLNHLPHEVFLEILLRLPLKTLVQCTSVCKSWSSTITNPSFITTHLNRSTASNTNSNTDLLLLRQFSKNQEKERYSLRLDNETSMSALNSNFRSRPYQNTTSESWVHLMACCACMMIYWGTDTFKYYGTHQSENS
ncbi:hypothetical protein L1049_023991 [Liquidambar formosana]|uniref:F-box domain-containing protein n=1 Tax=Liquidambar formosana TaxID=63359 RepID=A0AAP0WY28_LIQFO